LLALIDDHEEKEVNLHKQKETELREIERQKNALSIQRRFFDRKLEDERRALQQQFIEAKQELKRNFRNEADALKQRYGLQIDAAEREKKSETEELGKKTEKKN